MKKGFIIDVIAVYSGFNDTCHYVNMPTVLDDADESSSDMYADSYKLAYVFDTYEQAEKVAVEIENVFAKNYQGTGDFKKSGILGIQIINTEEIVSDEYIVKELAKFLRDETLEECPITIVSREDIEGEDAELVWFEFGEFNHKCPAIVYADGTTYTPYDWEDKYDDDWKIYDCDRWIDCYFRECIMFNGMPRIFL